MNAIEIRNLRKSFHGLHALDGLNLTVPVGSIYGFIGENGSGKSTTEKIICGHLVKDGGEVKLFGRKYTDSGVRQRVGALIENAGCFPNSSIYMNLKMQALNLNLNNIEEEIDRVLRIVRMEEHRNLKFKKCSLGMKQRVGIAMALLGDPALLILDEPINGLDTDGMKLMREILVDITKNYGCTVLISSHILGELEKIATHYGIIRQGKTIIELSAEELSKIHKSFISINTNDNNKAYTVLKNRFNDVKQKEKYIEIYDEVESEDILKTLFDVDIKVSEIFKSKFGLEEYYEEIMNEKGVK